MQLGLLSIVTPVNDTNIETVVGEPTRLLINGRSDGLAQIFGGYDKFSIWVLVRAIKDDNRLWIQKPPAIIDRNSNVWQANVYLGNQEPPPYSGESWIIMAVAAPTNSGMENIQSVNSLEDFPFDLIVSNLITIETEVKQ